MLNLNNGDTVSIPYGYSTNTNTISNTNTNINKDIKKSDKKKTIYEEIPEELVEPLKAFEEHRKVLKAPLTAHALELIVRKTHKLANGDTQVMIDILNQSIQQGWKGVFELSKPKKPRNEVLAILESGVLDD